MCALTTHCSISGTGPVVIALQELNRNLCEPRGDRTRQPQSQADRDGFNLDARSMHDFVSPTVKKHRQSLYRPWYATRLARNGRHLDLRANDRCRRSLHPGDPIPAIRIPRMTGNARWRSLFARRIVRDARGGMAWIYVYRILQRSIHQVEGED